MIRLIVKTIGQPPVDTPAHIEFCTFEVECPDLEYMLQANAEDTRYNAQVIGAEVILEE